jgi:hypothetical protein
MPFADRNGLIVRVLRRNPPARSAGIGFVVGDRHIVTCAHVVNTALGRDKKNQEEPGPDERLEIDFPILGDAAGAPSCTCQVACWVPPPKTGVSGGDVAGLTIVGKDLPDLAGPARLVSDDRFRGAEVHVFGYPADSPDRQSGTWITLRLRSAVGGGIVQLDTDSESAMRAQPGYSGSPVIAVDADGDAVTGMFAIAAEGSGRDAYAIPVSQIAAAWRNVLGTPELLGQAAAAAALQPTVPQPGLQQPTLAQVVAGNWLVDIQSPQLGFLKMKLALMIPSSGELQFQGSYIGTPVPVGVQGTWWVTGNQIKLSGVLEQKGPLPQKYPYGVIVTFTSWSFEELKGISSNGEDIICRRQG